MPRSRHGDRSFIGDDGFRYVWAGDDYGYFREHPDTQIDRLYFDSHSLKTEMVKRIEQSTLDEPTRIFCLFSINSAYLEQILNEYYDRAAVLCGEENPMAIMKEPTNKQIGIWTDKAGNRMSFAKLSLGQKHQAIQLVQFITDEDKKNYKQILAKFDHYIQLRNSIVHNLFSIVVSTENKQNDIQKALKLGEEIAEYLDMLDSVFANYILRNAGRYYDLRSAD